MGIVVSTSTCMMLKLIPTLSLSVSLHSSSKLFGLLNQTLNVPWQKMMSLPAVLTRPATFVVCCVRTEPSGAPGRIREHGRVPAYAAPRLQYVALPPLRDLIQDHGVAAPQGLGRWPEGGLTT